MRDKQRKLQLRSSPSHACMQEGDCVTAVDEQRESEKALLFLTCLSRSQSQPTPTQSKKRGKNYEEEITCSCIEHDMYDEPDGRLRQ